MEPHPNVSQMGSFSGIADFPPTIHFWENPQMVFASKQERSLWLYEFAERPDRTEKRTVEKR
ncbi:hypothetical protein CRE_31511 [Caenorhabditis remanei]|uniref:Uncharacterized protein n=1 Tax=Caenorhabditis remanei TaxID=31234 RepID=E3NGI1_CAERE|nr:hypothetical protein CRE_31511 [Caenorhabditis remanei]